MRTCRGKARFRSENVADAEVNPPDLGHSYFLYSSDGPLPTLVRNHTLNSTRWTRNESIFYAHFPLRRVSLGSMYIVPLVAFVLKQVIEEGMTNVLPACNNLQKLVVSRSLPAGPVREAIV